MARRKTKSQETEINYWMIVAIIAVIAIVFVLFYKPMNGNNFSGQALSAPTKQVQKTGWVVTKLADNAFYPDIDGNNVVYLKENGVYLYNTMTKQTRKLKQGTNLKSDVKIDGNKVVYYDNRGGNDYVYAYIFDISTNQEQQLMGPWDYSQLWGMPNLFDVSYVYINGIQRDRIVFKQRESGSGFSWIYFYDSKMNSGYPGIIQISQNAELPVIDGDNIAYVDHLDSDGPRIMLYKISTGQKTILRQETEDIEHLSISGNKVTYSYASGYANTYIIDIPTLTTTQVSANVNSQNMYGSISGSLISFFTENKVKIYDINTNGLWQIHSTISDYSRYDQAPRIDGYKTVWEEGTAHTAYLGEVICPDGGVSCIYTDNANNYGTT